MMNFGLTKAAENILNLAVSMAHLLDLITNVIKEFIMTIINSNSTVIRKLKQNYSHLKGSLE